MGYSLRDALIYGPSTELAPIFCKPLGSFLRSGAIASGPFFGAPMADFICPRFLSRTGQSALFASNFLTFPARPPIKQAKEFPGND
jgi:hypothetical protein